MGQIADWLVGEFTFLGIHFQHWMLVALAIVVLSILYEWLRR